MQGQNLAHQEQQLLWQPNYLSVIFSALNLWESNVSSIKWASWDPSAMSGCGERRKKKINKGIWQGCSCGLFSTVYILTLEQLWQPKCLSAILTALYVWQSYVFSIKWASWDPPAMSDYGEIRQNWKPKGSAKVVVVAFFQLFWSLHLSCSDNQSTCRDCCGSESMTK